MNYGQFITEIQKYCDLRDKGLNKQANRFLFAFTNRFKENVSGKEADDILIQFCKEYVDEKNSQILICRTACSSFSRNCLIYGLFSSLNVGWNAI